MPRADLAAGRPADAEDIELGRVPPSFFPS
jgi:hypothetical protein